MTDTSENHEHKILGITGTRHAVEIAGTKPARLASQRWSAKREMKLDGTPTRVRFNLRFDDQCKNGHPSFSVTGDTWERSRNGCWVEASGGCIHEILERAFPALRPLIPWHLSSSDGPMHYPGNVLYHAGDRDHWGRAPGEPSRYSECVRFGTNPIRHHLQPGFWAWLQNQPVPFPDHEVLDISEHKNGTTYRGYTVGGFPCDSWHKAPFKTEDDALRFVEAMSTQNPAFERVAIDWSEGKPRDLEAARACAIWPEATDAELCAPRDVLEAALMERLPGLIAELRRVVVDVCGLYWSAEDTYPAGVTA